MRWRESRRKLDISRTSGERKNSMKRAALLDSVLTSAIIGRPGGAAEEGHESLCNLGRMAKRRGRGESGGDKKSNSFLLITPAARRSSKMEA